MNSRRGSLLAVLVLLSIAALGVAARAEDGLRAATVQSDFSLGLGAQYQGIDGNERYFDRYVTPPADGYLSRLRWQRLDFGGGPSFGFDGLDLGQPDASASLWLYNPGFSFDGQYRRSTYFQDADPLSDRSRRRDSRFLLTAEPRAGASTVWGVGTSDVAVTGAPSRGPVDWETRTNTATFGLARPAGRADFSFSHEDFNLHTGTGLSGNAQNYVLSLAPTVSHGAEISASFARNITSLDGLTGGGVRSWDGNLTALYPLSDSLDLTGQLRRFSIDQTVTRNAYARTQTSGRLEAEYRWRPGTTLTAFVQSADTSYRDGLQLNGVSVGTNAAGLGLRSRLSRALKVTGKFSKLDNDHRPLAYKVDNSFAPTLIYSTLRRLDLSAAYAPGGLWGLTGAYGKRSWDNDVQSISNSLRTCALTGWWQALRGSLSMTASFMRQDFRLPLIDRATQQGYASLTNSWVLGANYTLSNTTNLYSNYADVNTYGATANEFRRLTLGATRDCGSGNHLLAEVNFGACWDDLAADLNYDADLYRVEWQHKF